MRQVWQVRDSTVFYRSFYEAIKDLPDADLAKCFKAIMEYALNEKEPETAGIEKSIYLLTKPQIDANNKRYQNGTKGGRGKSKDAPVDNQKETKQEPTANQCSTEPVPNVNENDNVNENVNVNKKYTCAFEELWKAYPRKKEKAGAYKSYKARLADGFSEDELMTAVKRYADECQKEKTEQKYIKHASTFLGPSTPFTDYLKEADNDTDGEAGTDEKGYISQLIEQGYDPGEFHGF